MKNLFIITTVCVAAAFGGCYYDLDKYLEDAGGAGPGRDAGLPKDDGGGTKDGGARDAGRDAGFDAGPDSSDLPDVSEDSGADAGEDAGVDAGEDAGIEYRAAQTSVYNAAAGVCSNEDFTLRSVSGWGAGQTMDNEDYVLKGTVLIK
jgi:hypothetical protein